MAGSSQSVAHGGGYGRKNGEIYDHVRNYWPLLPGCPVASMLTADKAGVFRQDSHGWLLPGRTDTYFKLAPAKQ
jgi:galactose oxidase